MDGNLLTKQKLTGRLPNAEIKMDGVLSNSTLRGYSAYQIAVENGFEGTEEEWLASLKGEPGHSPVVSAEKEDGVTTISVDDEPIAEINDGHSPIVSATKEDGVTTISVDDEPIAEINDGLDGHSPIVSATKEDGVTSIEVDGETVAEILDGSDGHSPVITAEKIDGVATISVDGEPIVEINDGEFAEIDDELSYESENPVQNKVITTALDNKADIDGTYSDMTVGNAEQLIDFSGSAEDVEAYLIRQSGGDKREKNKIVGGTIALNQLVKHGNFDEATGWNANGATIDASNNTMTVTVNVTGKLNNMAYINRGITTPKRIAGHKYYSCATVQVQTSNCQSITFDASYNGYDFATSITNPTANTWYAFKGIIEQWDEHNNSLRICAKYSSANVGDTFTIKNVMQIDLTQAFGATIADYIYSLEQTESGNGIAWLNNYVSMKPYFDFNPGQLISVEGLQSHDMVGFNQWDEEWEVGTISGGNNSNSTVTLRSKNFIPVIPGSSIYFEDPIPASSTNAKDLFYYDKSGNYLGNTVIISDNGRTKIIPNNAYFIRFDIRYYIQQYTTYNHDICLNISSDRNGEYEPYVKHSYPLDSTLTLRGIPKLDTNNHLYYNGDVYDYDGRITRKYGLVDLGTLSWAYQTIGDNHTFTSIGVSTVAVKPPNNSTLGNILCQKYITVKRNYLFDQDKAITITSTGTLNIVDSAYSDVNTFKESMSGIYLLYELATPVTEQAQPFKEIQIVDKYGTEQYVINSQSGITISVGAITEYMVNLVDKINALPDIAANNGTYVITQTDGDMELTELNFDGIDFSDRIKKGVGTKALAIGLIDGNVATGNYSFAGGNATKATKACSFAFGDGSTASGENSVAFGYHSTASGSNSLTIGGQTTASGFGSLAIGGGTTASGDYSFAGGAGSVASGISSFASGNNSQASGYGAAAFGTSGEASGNYSFVAGAGTKATSLYSSAFGQSTEAHNLAQHVFGKFNEYDPQSYYSNDYGKYVEIVGNGTYLSRSNARTLDWDGNETLAGKLTVGADPTNNMDVATKQYVDNSIPVISDQLWESGTGEDAIKSPYASDASGDYSLATGVATEASGYSAHAEGGTTFASGDFSHTEGGDTVASNDYAHAEGGNTEASGYCSHSEGNGTVASKDYAHAEGVGTTASGESSHSEGSGTVANHKSQHVFGEYNIPDPSNAISDARGNYIEIVGNGDSFNASNARTLDWSGNEVLAGKLTVGADPTNNFDVATKQYVDNVVDIATPEITSTKSGDTTTIYADGVAIATIVDGQDGSDGEDGHTPIITASKSGDTTTISVDGVSVATVVDGVDGQNGQDGQDGHSPTITASKLNGITTISVDGTAVATISDGEDGQDGQDGHSPVITAEKVDNVVTISVDGEPIATIEDGDIAEIDDELDDDSENPVQNKVIVTALNNKANTSGEYDDFVAGKAKQIVTETGEINKVPYTLRASGGGVTVGEIEADKIVGGSVVWNQLADTDKWTLDTWGNDNFSIAYDKPNGKITVTIANDLSNRSRMPFSANNDRYMYHVPKDHIIAVIDTSQSTFSYCNNYNAANVGVNTLYKQRAVVSNRFWLGIDFPSGTQAGTYTFRPMLFDLTAMFGTTIADYIYTLEQSTAGAGVAIFRKLFPNAYYAYDAGTLMSVSGVSAHKMRDVDDNVIAEYPLDSTLTLRGVPKLDSDNHLYYDGDIYESDGTVARRYGTVDLGTLNWSKATYDDKIQWQSSYVTTAAATANKVQVISAKYLGMESKGNEYSALNNPDKSINVIVYGSKPYFGIMDSAFDVMTASEVKSALSGTVVIYELATPTTESATPYEPHQKVSSYGTEEYVTTGIVPVGHETFYYTNLRKKLEDIDLSIYAKTIDLAPYVKNTDYATSSKGGAVKINGNGLSINSTSGLVSLSKASSANIKAGTNQYNPVVSYNQHESVFYGLAKAAGDSTQASSSNTVGTYTDTAKTAIQTMLGVGSITDINNKIDKSAIDYAGISARTYGTFFGGEFSVTTAAASGFDNPMGMVVLSESWNFYKYHNYRVTVNGVEHILPTRFWFAENQEIFSYVGNIELLIGDEANTIPGDIDDDVNFLILRDFSATNTLDVFTETAGTYTIVVEQINETVDPLPNSLIYQDIHCPVDVMNNGNSYFNGFSIGVNSLKENLSMSAVAIGIGNVVNGNVGVAIGSGNKITNSYGTTIGYKNTSADYGVALGVQNQAGSGAVAMGLTCNATGVGAMAVGSGNIASGMISTAFGWGSRANHLGQFVFGEYNIPDPSTELATSRGNYIEIVGNGSSLSSQSNARTLDWSGNEVLAGKLTVGAAPTNNMDVATKKYVDDSVGGIDLSDYVTNTDYATQSTGGVVKVLNSGGGVQIDQGYLLIQNATLADIKSGTNVTLNPIVPGNQYASTFYGLAKAAGDTTQSQSSNAVGTYTDDAKTAIRSMIDAEKAVATVVVSGSSPTVNALANTIYKCGEVTSLSFTPCATGICDIIFTSGSTPTVLTVPNTIKFPVWFNPASISANTVYEINVLDGVYGVVTTWAV